MAIANAASAASIQATQAYLSSQVTRHKHHHGNTDNQQTNAAALNVGPAATVEIGTGNNSSQGATYQNPLLTAKK